MTNEPAPAGNNTGAAHVGNACALSIRDRSLITVSRLVALNRAREIPAALERALEDGVSRDELIELVAHIAHGAGRTGP